MKLSLKPTGDLYTIEHLNTLFDQYSFVKEITSETSGQYREFLVLNKVEARHSEIKMVDISGLSQKRIEHYEALIHRSMEQSHPNLIQTQNYWVHEHLLFIVTSEHQAERLDHVIDEGRLSFKRTLELITQVCSYLDYVHSEKSYHTAICPRSVFVDKDYFVYINPSYFNRLLIELAPELHTDSEITSFTGIDKNSLERCPLQSDIYSTGALICYLSTGYAADMIRAKDWIKYGVDKKVLKQMSRAVGHDDFRYYTTIAELAEELEQIQSDNFSTKVSDSSMQSKMHRLKLTQSWSTETTILAQEYHHSYDEAHKRTEVLGGLLNERYEVGECVEFNILNKVFEAKDRKLQNKTVWIHMLDYNHDPEWSFDFRTIAQRLNYVCHPHISQVLDTCLLENSAYISTQKERGERLTQFARRHHFTWADVQQFCFQISDALREAYNHGFYVHTLSTDTISVYKNPEGGYFYRIIGLGSTELLKLDHSGEEYFELLKNPETLAPEIYQHELQGFQTTQFLFGNIIFRLLANYHPCENMNNHEAYQYHSSMTESHIQRYRTETPDNFAQWLSYLTDPDYTKRYTTPDEVIKGLVAVCS